VTGGYILSPIPRISSEPMMALSSRRRWSRRKAVVDVSDFRSQGQISELQAMIKLDSAIWASPDRHHRYVASADGSLVSAALYGRWQYFVRRVGLDVKLRRAAATAIMLLSTSPSLPPKRSLPNDPSDMNGTLQGDAGIRLAIHGGDLGIVFRTAGVANPIAAVFRSCRQSF